MKCLLFLNECQVSSEAAGRSNVVSPLSSEQDLRGVVMKRSEQLNRNGYALMPSTYGHNDS